MEGPDFEVIAARHVDASLKEKAEALAGQMAAQCDVFVHDAFGTAHRAQASTHGVAAQATEACAGLLLVCGWLGSDSGKLRRRVCVVCGQFG